MDPQVAVSRGLMGYSSERPDGAMPAGSSQTVSGQLVDGTFIPGRGPGTKGFVLRKRLVKMEDRPRDLKARFTLPTLALEMLCMSRCGATEDGFQNHSMNTKQRQTPKVHLREAHLQGAQVLMKSSRLSIETVSLPYVARSGPFFSVSATGPMFLSVVSNNTSFIQ